MEVTFKGGLGELERANALSNKTTFPLSLKRRGGLRG
jgi:hypothetical protein